MRQTQGFTLIELMVTIAVLAIILGIAVPNFTDQIRNNRSLAFGEEFATALNLARSEAVKRSSFVSICASGDDQASCGSDWTNGWLVFVDSAANGSAAPGISNVNNDILRFWDSAGDEMSLTVSRGAAVNYVRFDAMGALAGNNANAVQAVAKHAKCTGEAARSIRVTVAGSVRASRADC